MLTRFRFDSGRVARKGSVGTVTVKQACGQPEKTTRYPGRPGICRHRLHEGGAVPERGILCIFCATTILAMRPERP